MNKVIFLTGATGLVGGNLIPRILNNDSQCNLILLVRGNSQTETEQRVHSVLVDLMTEPEICQARRRITILKGDITDQNLGLNLNDFRYWASRITHLIHSAANVSFRQPLDQARQINFFGTENVMELARAARNNGNLQKVAYVSTAYISGKRNGKIYEEELDCGQDFANTYEQSKYESELQVRKLMRDLPITVFRPSIIVGDSKSGKTRAFNVLYLPLKLLYRGMLKMLPGSPFTPTDVVPVDYVCDALCHIFFNRVNCSGKTYHLTAGETYATTTGEVVDLAVQYFNQVAGKKKYTAVRFVPVQFYHAVRHFVSGQAKKIFQVMDTYESYLLVNKSFDDSNTRAALSGSGISIQRFNNYYRSLFDYCLATNWGEKYEPASG